MPNGQNLRPIAVARARPLDHPAGRCRCAAEQMPADRRGEYEAVDATGLEGVPRPAGQPLYEKRCFMVATVVLLISVLAVSSSGGAGTLPSAANHTNTVLWRVGWVVTLTCGGAHVHQRVVYSPTAAPIFACTMRGQAARRR